MRLIDADALKDGLIDYQQKHTDSLGDDYWIVENVLLRIEEMPTIDAEPVIRCKDCIYFHDYGDGVKNCWSDGGGIFTKDDDFCSHAERKDG